MAEELLSMEKEVEGASNEGLRTVEGEVQLLAVGQDVGAGQEKMVEKDFQKMSLGYSARETEKGAMDQRGEKEVEGDDGRSEQGGDGVDQALKDALARHRHRNTVLLFEQEVEKFVKSDSNEYVFEREMTTYEVCAEA